MDLELVGHTPKNFQNCLNKGGHWRVDSEVLPLMLTIHH